MRLATIAPHQAFLDALAADWLAQAGDDPLAVAEGLVLLPTRRAARALAEAFLARTDGRPLLLPRIIAIGAPDESPLALAGALSLPPAIPAPLRLANLARLVMALDGRFGAPVTADHAWPLAAELATLMDEAERAEVDLAAVLPRLVAEDYAAHWGITLDFLRIVTRAWPDFLAEVGMMNPAARQVRLLDAQAAAWGRAPPLGRVVAAGSTGGIPAVARLLRVVAGLPRGQVVLPGLDLELAEESWAGMGESHPQAGMQRLLTRLGATRGDVQAHAGALAAPPGRTTLLQRALLPAAALEAWRAPLPDAPAGLWRLTPADQQEEALAIALILRGALETPGHQAALVTPDRSLAGRVAVELGRFGIVADDSAGEPLDATPPAVFLRLLAQAVADGLRPVPLLALLKHPLAAAGLAPAACRAAARRLERHSLRGPAPPPGLAGLRGATPSEAVDGFVDRVGECLAPLLAVSAAPASAPAEALRALLAAAEALASTPDAPGVRRLWAGEDGQALATLLAELLPALAVLPQQPADTLPGLLDAALAGATVRSRRALRGRDGAEHPRVAIWGLLEARLQRADLIVLGGLAEGVWPAATDPGPWMSRPMRAAAGLSSPEEAVGQAAHDWLMTACAAPQVVFSCPLRRDGAPAVPARWLQRLDAMLRGAGQSLAAHPAAGWARALDQPDRAPPRLKPPAPRPALRHRPRVLRVTEVETWLRDPYAIYARRVLGLKALRPLEEPADAADYGTVVHAAVHAFLREVGTRFPADAAQRLVAAMDQALEGQALRPALVAWWRPRLRRIAHWIAEAERDRRAANGLAHVVSEVAGDWMLPTALPFTLRGRADRIERRADGGIAILDYKTGTPPAAREVQAGLAPQLLLEAAMAADGSFGAEVAGPARELTYWHLTGGFVAGEAISLFKQDANAIGEVVDTARHRLEALVTTFDDPNHPYLSRPHPGQAPRFSDYTQLARVAEWAALEEGGVTEAASARATNLQREASDPRVSAFVAASAGSGKTKLLVDRLLRLMLQGADPTRILCLTFTKAAAAEMALRLQRILGEWVTLPAAALAEALKQRGITPDAATTLRARGLFAQVLDLPGGMRISTIHAFCQSLLRRFPLEAALAPHFRLLEEADGHAELQGAREDAMAEADPAALATIAGLVTDMGFGRLVAELRPKAAALRPLLALPAPARLARLQRAAGASGDDATVLRAGACWPDAALRAALTQLQANGTPAERELAVAMLDWLGLGAELRVAHWDAWLDLVLTKDGTPRKAGAFCRGKWAKGDPALAAACVAAAEHAAAVEDDRRALKVAAATDALLTLAAPVLAGFERRKQRGGLLDYDDLVTRSSALLRDPGVAWVLFKLDGGLDHLLLDEVQDTAAEQWAIAGALTDEFFATEDAAEGARTVFAVGDRKQSIYSFQGADPAGFDFWRGQMGDAARRAGGTFRNVALDVSFRSTAAVLGLVDAVFADAMAATGVVPVGETLHHEADRAGHGGRVELWPLVPLPPHEPPEPWAVAERNHGLVTAPQRLADALGQWIAAQIGRATLPGRGRTVQAGDILILVRRRDDFARALVRRLKGLGVAVAGLDRLYLTDQPAVQDLLALCDTLLLPQDDLSLACVLTSPLGELTDDDLMALAIERDGSLWSALRRRRAERPQWARAAAFIEALLARVDYVTPHALLVEALGPLGSRARLLRRLGPEAAEPIDELLGAALAHAAAHPPSLQGFVHWLRQSGAEVKRQAEEAGRAVRIMTVHGAKGLQAPLVVLPDTTSLPPDAGGLLWDGDAPLWSPRAELRCAAVDRLRAAGRQARMEEYNRLLYVALTRAEDRLLVCGWQTRGAVPEETWYQAVRRGMQAVGAAECPLQDVGEAWDGAVLRHDSPQTAPVAAPAPEDAAETPAALPVWVGGPPEWVPHATPSEPARPVPLAPSRPADAWLGPVPHAASPASGDGAARTRGTLVHGLLQHAPALPEDEREAAIAERLRVEGAPAGLLGEVMAIIAHPQLAPLFGPLGRAEQPITGLVDGAIISGVVDRMAVLADTVLLADYKTNRDAPERVEDTPVLYLRQMAAYRAVLQAMFPSRAVRCHLVWTRSAAVMKLPDALLDGHAPRVA